MFSSHLTSGLHLVAAHIGMCYFSLLTATSLKVVCLEQEKKQEQRYSSIYEPVDDNRMSTPKWFAAEAAAQRSWWVRRACAAAWWWPRIRASQKEERGGRHACGRALTSSS